MPAFSGLYDAIHKDGYSALREQTRPTMLRGLTRVIMQKRGMHGVVNALGQSAPATIARVDADRGDITVPGSTNAWPDRTLNRNMTVTNIEPAYSGETIARVPDPSTADLNRSLDTTFNEEYVADDALTGATSDALPAEDAAP